MRIALCFAGQPRNVESTYHSSIKPHLFDPNTHHDIDVFVHTWYEQKQEGQPYINAGNHPCSIPVPSDVLNTIYRLYDPVKMVVQRPARIYYPTEWDAAVGSYTIRPEYSISRMFSTKEVIEMTEVGEYDVIGIGRFDSAVQQPILFDELNKPAIFDLGFAPHGINILWMFGNSEVMLKYAQLPMRIPEILNDGIPFCDEYLIKHFLHKENIPLIPLNISAHINTEH